MKIRMIYLSESERKPLYYINRMIFTIIYDGHTE